MYLMPLLCKNFNGLLPIEIFCKAVFRVDNNIGPTAQWKNIECMFNYFDTTPVCVPHIHYPSYASCSKKTSKVMRLSKQKLIHI